MRILLGGVLQYGVQAIFRHDAAAVYDAADEWASVKPLSSLQFRLSAMLCCMVLAVLAVSGVFMARFVEDRMRAQARDNLTLVIGQLSSQLSYIESEMSQLSVRVAVDSEVQLVIRELLDGPDPNRAVVKRRVLKDLLKSCQVDYSGVLSIDVLCANGVQCSSLGYFQIDSQNAIPGAGWYEEFKLRPQVWRGFSQIHPFYWSGHQYDAITYISPLVDLLDVSERLGEVFVNVDFAKLQQYIEPLGASFQYLEVSYDDVLLCGVGAAEDLGQGTDGRIEVESSNGRFRISALISDRDIEAAYAGAVKVVLLVFAIATVAVGIIIAGTVVRITRPLAELKRAAQLVAEGDLSAKVSIHSGDELEALGSAFNEMVARIDVQIGEILENQCALNAARMELLVSQIKPHFIYNTLDSVIYMIQMNKQDEAVNLLRHFIRLLQNSMPPGVEGTFATLDEEFRAIEEYLSFQQLRYPGRFRFELELNERTPRVQVPRMLLQPLIENALYHGVLGSEDARGEIVVRAVPFNGMLKLTIADNGGGFDAALLNMDWLEAGKQGGAHGVGIRNTIQRLRLFYGADDAFRIDNRDGWAVCTLTLPLNFEGFDGWQMRSGGRGSDEI